MFDPDKTLHDHDLSEICSLSLLRTLVLRPAAGLDIKVSSFVHLHHLEIDCSSDCLHISLQICDSLISLSTGRAQGRIMLPHGTNAALESLKVPGHLVRLRPHNSLGKQTYKRLLRLQSALKLEKRARDHCWL